MKCKEATEKTDQETIAAIKKMAAEKGYSKLKINIVKVKKCHVCGKPASFKNANDPHWYCRDHK